jgi:hypothetical protein
MIRSLVGPEEMHNAVALNTIQMQSAQVVWPSLAGAMIAVFDVGPTLATSAALSVIGIVFLQAVHMPPQEPKQRPNQLHELAAGIRYCLTEPRISALTSMALLAGCFGLFYSHVAPGYSREILGFDAGATGIFMMAIGVGSIAGSLVMLIVRVQDSLRMYFIGSAGLGLSIACMAATPWAAVALVPNAFFGVFLAVMIVSGQTVIQSEVPSDFLGRVTSAWTIAGGVGLVSSLPVGALGEELGLRYVLIVVGCTLALVALGNGILRASVMGRRAVSTAAA